jgi:hypothetical protein
VDENIIDHFLAKLLQNPRRVMNEKLQIVEIYDQPERSKREDFFGCKAIVDKDGILTFETGEKYDLNQPIEDAVL